MMHRLRIAFFALACCQCAHRSGPQPLPKRDVARAQHEKWHDPFYLEPHTWEEMEAHALQWADDHNVAIEFKDPGEGRWAKSGTAFCDRVLLPSRFFDYKVGARVRMMVHELVHVRQCRSFGQALFGVRYGADASFRWSIEANADIERVRAYVSSGTSLKKVRKDAVEQAEQLYDYYELSIGGLDREHVDAVSRSLYLSAIPEDA